MKLFVCIFDDARLLPHFLRHYDSLGIEEFHIAVPAGLARDVARVAAPYRAVLHADPDTAETVTGGITAVTRMRELVQAPDEWVVIVDLDEFVEFDNPVPKIVPRVEAEGANVARGIMYDRFPADGRPRPFDDSSDLPTLYPVRAPFIRNVMRGFDVKGVLVKGHLEGRGAHHLFHGERPFSEVFAISHYKWNDPSLGRIQQAYEMSRAAGLPWSGQYKRVLDHYAEHGRFAWETFGGELVGRASPVGPRPGE